MDLTRRDFVAAAAVGAACAFCSCGDALAAEPAGGVLDAGPAKDFPQGITNTFAKSNNVMVVRKDDQLWATTATCTHRNSTLTVQNNNLFYCPRHKSKFDEQGNVEHGPAKLPLVHYAVSINSDGHLIVDSTKKFDKSKWDDAAANVKLS